MLVPLPLSALTTTPHAVRYWLHSNVELRLLRLNRRFFAQNAQDWWVWQRFFATRASRASVCVHVWVGVLCACVCGGCVVCV